MESRHAVGTAARTFYLAFHRWHVANHFNVHRLQHCQKHIRPSSTPSRSTTRCLSTRATTVRSKTPMAKTLVARKRGTPNQMRALSSVPEKDNTSLSNDLRHALRTLTKPCVVVTACIDRDTGPSWSGATLSSFDTVCLEPTPYVSFNIRLPSRTYIASQYGGQICVHLLSATTQGAAIANAFTKSYPEEMDHYAKEGPFAEVVALGADVMHSQDSPVPQISLPGANIAWLWCSRNYMTPEMAVGDHTICVFKVDRIVMADGAEINHADALAYGQQAFRSLGGIIEPQEAHPVATTQSSTLPQRQQTSHALSANTTSRVRLKGIGSLPAATAAGFHTYRAVRADLTLNQYSPSAGLEAPQEEEHSAAEHEQIEVDPQVLKQTVSDFLCHSQKIKTFRMKKARTARREAEEASAEIEQRMQDGTLTEKRSRALETIVTSNERYIKIELAINATTDLREMLDEGKVSRSRIQYIEACIEQGQKALMEEAEVYAAGEKRNHHIKIHLPHDAAFKEKEELFRTELMRLRELYEEEEAENMLD